MWAPSSRDHLPENAVCGVGYSPPPRPRLVVSLERERERKGKGKGKGKGKRKRKRESLKEKEKEKEREPCPLAQVFPLRTVWEPRWRAAIFVPAALTPTSVLNSALQCGQSGMEASCPQKKLLNYRWPQGTCFKKGNEKIETK